MKTLGGNVAKFMCRIFYYCVKMLNKKTLLLYTALLIVYDNIFCTNKMSFHFRDSVL